MQQRHHGGGTVYGRGLEEGQTLTTTTMQQSIDQTNDATTTTVQLSTMRQPQRCNRQRCDNHNFAIVENKRAPMELEKIENSNHYLSK